MDKILNLNGQLLKGSFIPLPGKENYGHFLSDNKLLTDENGRSVVVTLGKEDQVVIHGEAVVTTETDETTDIYRLVKSQTVDHKIYLKDVKDINISKVAGRIDVLRKRGLIDTQKDKKGTLIIFK